jgi:C1A family cysteine protease
MQRSYPLVRQKEDTRDLVCSIEKSVKIPDKVDLRSSCPEVFDQLDTNSCTANAGAAAYMMRKGIKDVMSREILYWFERELEGTTSQDGGATMRNIGKALNKYGITSETLWPFSKANITKAPPDTAVKDAVARAGVAYKALSNSTTIKQYIATEKQPAMIGVEVYSSFESGTVSNTGMVPIPDKTKEKCLGGHAILLVGYDDNFAKTHKTGGFLSSLLDGIADALTGTEDDGYFIFRNSWGKDWGDGGYGYLPYAFVDKFAYDFWVLE